IVIGQQFLSKTFLKLLEKATDIAIRISISGDIAMMQWALQADQALSHCEIRFSQAITGATWQTASQLRTNVVGSQAQVPAMVGTYLI
ncbi:hypothetical protein ACC708_36300, partial [Rhizobium ruizarguesonis]